MVEHQATGIGGAGATGWPRPTVEATPFASAGATSCIGKVLALTCKLTHTYFGSPLSHPSSLSSIRQVLEKLTFAQLCSAIVSGDPKPTAQPQVV